MSDKQPRPTDNRQPITDNRQPITDNRQPITDNRQPTLDHIGIAVTSLDEVRIYEALGLKVDHVEVVESQGVKTAFVPVGDSNVELLEPTRPDSPVGRFMEKRGPGIHHICFRVANLDSELARLKDLGFRLVHETPVPGSRGSRVAFLHPSAGEGVLIELSERVGSHD